jgi:hypothetical protein
MKYLLLVLPFLAACSSSYMRDAAPSGPLGPDEARIVVYRTSAMGFARTFPVYDGEELIGFSEVGSSFESIRKSGSHVFIAWGESDGVVHAELAPQKTYYLELYPTIGFFTAGVGLTPVPATPDTCAKIDETLKSLAHRELIPERGAAWVESHKSKEEKKLKKHEGEEINPKQLLKSGDGR